jgi:hypothetical protein
MFIYQHALYLCGLNFIFMLNSKFFFGICFITIVNASCAAHKHKNHIKPCNCPDSSENIKNKKQSENIFHFNDGLNEANSYFA